MKQKPTGTREWAVQNINFVKGCPHNCRYCYARANALRFGQIKRPEQWQNWSFDPKKVKRRFNKREGNLMFPSTHDIIPEVLEPAIDLLRRMLEPGNRVIIVTKPHLGCVTKICHQLEEYKEQILWRFTIGSIDNEVLSFWEPGAPNWGERHVSLMYAFKQGFHTSVSAEPFLDHRVRELVDSVEDLVTDAIWIGPMNKMEQRGDRKGWGHSEEVFWRLVKESQTKEEIQRLYNDLKDHPKVKWKNSIKEMLGLPMAEEIGKDE